MPLWPNDQGRIVNGQKLKQTLYETLRQNRLYYTNVATEIRISLTFYGRRVGDNEDATGFTSN